MKNLQTKKTRLYIVAFALVLLVGILFSGCDSPLTENLEDVYNDLTQKEDEDLGTLPEKIEIPETKAEETSIPEPEVNEEEPEEAETAEEENPENEKTVVDLMFFMGQSNMAGCGGNTEYAPKVKEGAGYEFRAISDPTQLYPITEPFGINENNINAIMDVPGAKKGSLVSAFVNRYYELTNTPVVAVSASAGATDTDFWMSDAVVADYNERMKRALVWLECSGYEIRHKYVIWLQGESDAIDNTSSDVYEGNMDNIIRPMFIEGIEKLFFITPGRTITRKNYFQNIIAAQIKMSKESGYYALGTTALSGISTEYMVDEWHYNQKVLNFIGEQCADSVAYYTLNGKECSLYDYRNMTMYYPDTEGADTTPIEPIDFSKYDFNLD